MHLYFSISYGVVLALSSNENYFKQNAQNILLTFVYTIFKIVTIKQRKYFLHNCFSFKNPLGSFLQLQKSSF